MKTLSLATALAAAAFLMATTQAAAQSHGGHMMGSGHAGSARFAAHSHGFNHGGFRADGRFLHDGRFHDGRFFHGGHFSSFVVVGGIWYPWYAYAAPVYANSWYYYCPSAGAYYPYVTVCPEPWVLVAP